MGLMGWLTLPIFGPIRGVAWVAEKVVKGAEGEWFDEGRVRADLLEWEARYVLGEVSEAEYSREEAALLERLNAVREAKGG